MVELNQQITWVPGHVKDGQFGKWLENARDWSISRNRFWGSPIPVWVVGRPGVPAHGRVRLARRAGARLRRAPDRPAPPVRRRADPPEPGRPDGPVDDAPRPRGARLLVRVGLDAVRAGALPVRERDWFEHHYPGDFIVEYNGQTRGWFYTLHVLATALFDRPAFRDCVAHGIVLGDDGAEDVQVAEELPGRQRGLRPRRLRRHALVPHVVADPARRQPRRDRAGHPRRACARRSCRCGTPGTSSRCTPTRPGSRGHVADRLDARARPVRPGEDARPGARRHGGDGRLRHRRRVRSGARVPGGADELVRAPLAASGSGTATQDAIDTLHTVLEVVARVAAPLLPLTTEVVWRGLTGGRSVHLTDWPVGGGPAARRRAGDGDGRGARRCARRRCRCARRNKLRVRLPLAR